MIVLVTGSTGFVGKNLCRTISGFSELDVFTVNRKGELFSLSGSVTPFEEFRASRERIAVFNLAGSAVKDINLLKSANIEFPRELLNRLEQHNLQYAWIQASSFFQLYKKIYGIDKDSYSKTKDQAIDLIRKRMPNGDFYNLFFPHTFGEYESKSRLIPQLRHAKSFKRWTPLASGKSVMPVLPVDRVVAYLKDLLFGGNVYDEFALLQTPILSVTEIAQIILEGDLSLAGFGTLSERENEFYDKEPFLELQTEGAKIIEKMDLCEALLG